MPLNCKKSLIAARILPFSLILALVGCGGGSSDNTNNSTVDPAENTTNNFPTITIRWPSPLIISFVLPALDPAATSRQVFIRANITSPGTANELELRCQAAVDATNAQTEQVAYNDLIANSSSNISFVEVNDTTSVDGRKGREYLYNQTEEDGSISTGLAHAYYFNATADRLFRNWRYLVQCLGETADFSNRRTLINRVLASIDFSPVSRISRSASTSELPYTVTDNGQLLIDGGVTTFDEEAKAKAKEIPESSSGL